MSPAELAALEVLVDNYSLAYVLAVLGQICLAKADHIGQESYSDRVISRLWRRAAKVCERASTHNDVAVLS